MALQFEREVNVMKYAALMQKVRDRGYICSRSNYDTYESYHKAQAELDKQFHDDVVSMIMEEYGNRIYRHNLNEKMAEKIFNQAWEDGHANGYHDVAWRAKNLAELVDDCIFEIGN